MGSRDHQPPLITNEPSIQEDVRTAGHFFRTLFPLLRKELGVALSIPLLFGCPLWAFVINTANNSRAEDTKSILVITATAGYSLYVLLAGRHFFVKTRDQMRRT